MKMTFRILGSLIYILLKNLNLRFLFPEKFIRLIEKTRTYALVMQGARIGHGSIVRSAVFIAFPKNLTIGRNVTVGSYSRIYNYSVVNIGDESEIGPGLHIQTNDHVWMDPCAPLGKQGSITKPITIGKGVFIGANVTILGGNEIMDYGVVAAGAVVTKSTESGFLYGGVPAKKICSTDRLRSMSSKD